MKNTIFAISAVSAVFAAPLVAQEAPQGFSIGIGATFGEGPYIGHQDAATALPILRYQGNGFRVGTDGASLDLIRSSELTIETILLPRFTSLNDPDAPEMAGIDRNITGDLGLRLTYGITRSLDLEATVLQEITGEHDGQEVILGFQQGIELANLPVNLGAGVSWKSQELTNYMYGVGLSEATGARPAYDTDSSLTPYLSISSGVPLARDVLLTGSIKAEFYESKVESSPIVDSGTNVTGFLGFIYSF